MIHLRLSTESVGQDGPLSKGAMRIAPPNRVEASVPLLYWRKEPFHGKQPRDLTQQQQNRHRNQDDGNAGHRKDVPGPYEAPTTTAAASVASEGAIPMNGIKPIGLFIPWRGEERETQYIPTVAAKAAEA